MTTRFRFQYKVLRYTHDSFTGEFLNIGLVLYSPQIPYLRARFLNRYSRIKSVFPDLDGNYYSKYIIALQSQFDSIVEKVNSKQLSLYPGLPADTDELVRRILPLDDSAIQFGPSYGGASGDLDLVFSDLYSRFVECYIPNDDRTSRNDDEVWQLFSRPLRQNSTISKLRKFTISTKNDDVVLEHAWKNGKINALQPISFDLVNPTSIQRKAHQWLGTSVVLDSSPEVGEVYYLLGGPDKTSSELRKAYLKAKDLLGTKDYSKKIKLIEEDEAEQFVQEISPKIIEDSKHSGHS